MGGPIVTGVLASTAAGLATGVGALPALFFRRVSQKVLDAALGFAAGIMVAASVFSLIAPALSRGGTGSVAAGTAGGVAFLAVIDRLVPHLHAAGGREGPASRLRQVWLLVLAITIHNFPEGLSVGVGFGAGDPGAGILLAAAIGVQNLPEGIAVALPLVQVGYSRVKAVGFATLTGLAEPVAAFVGAASVTSISGLLPFGLGFAAGAMLYVVFDEIVPESRSRGNQKEAAWAGSGGFVLMALLHNLLG